MPSYNDIAIFEFRRHMKANLFINVIVNLKERFCSIEYHDELGVRLETKNPYDKDLTLDELSDFLKIIEDIKILDWPYQQHGEFTMSSKMPNAIYSFGDKLFYTFGDPNNAKNMLDLHQATEKLIGLAIGDSSDYDDFDLIRDYKQLTTLIFNVQDSQKNYHDVTIDIELNSSFIEETDEDGNLLSDFETKPLRRSSVRKFVDKLEDLDLLSWPVEHSQIQTIGASQPFLEYYIEDVTFFTYGDPTDSTHLPTLHRTIENLVGKTFGSYQWYE